MSEYSLAQPDNPGLAGIVKVRRSQQEFGNWKDSPDRKPDQLSRHFGTRLWPRVIEGPVDQVDSRRIASDTFADRIKAYEFYESLSGSVSLIRFRQIVFLGDTQAKPYMVLWGLGEPNVPLRDIEPPKPLAPAPVPLLVKERGEFRETSKPKRLLSRHNKFFQANTQLDRHWDDEKFRWIGLYRVGGRFELHVTDY